MNKVVFSSDENKLHLTPSDLFDRIINLKLICEDKTTKEMETFVIRSDYELVYTNVDLDNFVRKQEVTNKKYMIRRCTFKPSIKVQCKMVTSNTATSVDIFINNFFMLTKDGNYIRSFNSSQYNIKAVLVAMGYWGQFENTVDPTSPNALEQYFDIKAENGADSLMLSSPIVVTTDKLPPDSTLRLHGYVADIYSSPVGVTNVKEAQKAFEKPSATSSSTMDEIFYENITRRYINPHSYMEDREIGSLGMKKLVPVSKDSDVEFIKQLTLDSDTNQLSKADADKYGVKVYLSDEVKNVQMKKTYDSDGNEVDRKIYFEPSWTIGQTIVRIMSYMDAELEFTFDLNGDVLIYTPKEMLSKLEELGKKYNENYKDTVLAQEDLYRNAIPAVYNINIDAVATIVCPFFTFIQPFQYIEFASRYALTSVVSYYASYKPTIYRFLVINATISFATEEAVNEVQITAVSAIDSVID